MSLRLVHGWRDLEPIARGAAVALGNFDGVHRGHRLVIAEAAKAARALKAPLGVIRFTPHPAALLRPDDEPYLLMTPAQQARALEDLGVELLYDLPFAEITVLSDEQFARDVLKDGLGVRHVAAGYDIRFGHGRTGDAESLKRLGERYGFSVSIAPRVIGGIHAGLAAERRHAKPRIVGERGQARGLGGVARLGERVLEEGPMGLFRLGHAPVRLRHGVDPKRPEHRLQLAQLAGIVRRNDDLLGHGEAPVPGRQVFSAARCSSTRRAMPLEARSISFDISSFVKGSPSAVPWISTKRPLPVMTTFMSVSQPESSA